MTGECTRHTFDTGYHHVVLNNDKETTSALCCICTAGVDLPLGWARISRGLRWAARGSESELKMIEKKLFITVTKHLMEVSSEQVTGRSGQKMHPRGKQGHKLWGFFLKTLLLGGFLFCSTHNKHVHVDSWIGRRRSRLSLPTTTVQRSDRPLSHMSDIITPVPRQLFHLRRCEDSLG